MRKLYKQGVRFWFYAGAVFTRQLNRIHRFTNRLKVALLLFRISTRNANSSKRIIFKPRDHDPLLMARRFKKRHGYYPISFSYMRDMVENAKTHLVSPTIPGKPYSYDDEAEYLNQYRESHFAITFKKGGWDCMRHLEILFSGAIPLMPDAGRIPAGVMNFYPKKTIKKTYLKFMLQPNPPTNEIHEYFIQWSKQWLTSEAMAQYILDSIGVPANSKILFLNEHFLQVPDYLSVMTLTGLSKYAPKRVVSGTPIPDFLFTDFVGSTQTLYGRGFGFTRVVERNSVVIESGYDTHDIDCVIIPNIIQHEGLVRQIRSKDLQVPIVGIAIGDEGTTKKQLALFKSLNVDMFLREGLRRI